MGFIHRHRGVDLHELELKAYRDKDHLMHFVAYLKERGTKVSPPPRMHAS